MTKGKCLVQMREVKGMRLRAGLWLLLFLVMLGVAARQFSGTLPLQTNLLALLPETERNPVAEVAISRLADALGNRAVFLVSAGKAESSASAAREFAGKLRETPVFRHVLADLPPIDPRQLTDFYRPWRFNLLSDADAGSLAADHFDAGGRLATRLHSPFCFGPTLSLADDPFGFAEAWLSGLPLKNFRLEMEDGLLVAREGEKTWVLVSGELSASAYDNRLQEQLLPAVNAAEKSLRERYGELEVLRTGAVFYAAEARESATREVDFIGTGSLVGMLLLLYLVFRSPRPLFLGLLAVGFGILSAVVVTLSVFGELHLITLVFGASLTGEAIDYAIQYFAAHLGAGADWQPMSGLRRIAPGLLVALATSLMGYGALMLAPFPALSQIALFALTGLIGACLSVFLLLPWLLQRPGRRDPEQAVAFAQNFLNWWQQHGQRKACLLLAAVLVAIALPGILQLTGDDDVHLLVTRPPALIAQEEKIRALSGFSGSSQFFLIEGADAQAALRHEEALATRLEKSVEQGVISGFTGVSAFVPSAARQTRNYGLLQTQLFRADRKLSVQLSEAGLRDEVALQLQQDFQVAQGKTFSIDDWLKQPFSAPYRIFWMGEQASGGFASIVQPQGLRDVAALRPLAEGLSGVTFVDKAGSVSQRFGEYRQFGAQWLPLAFLLVYGVLCLRYGLRQAGWMLLPTLLAMMLSLSAFGYLGIPLTLFNLMALMLVLGVGVNYSVFLREGGVHAAATLAGVVLSAGTTLLSFGLLAFSSLPALSGFGLTLLLGIGCASLLAPMVLVFTKGQGK